MPTGSSYPHQQQLPPTLAPQPSGHMPVGQVDIVWFQTQTPEAGALTQGWILNLTQLHDWPDSRIFEVALDPLVLHDTTPAAVGES